MSNLRLIYLTIFVTAYCFSAGAAADTKDTTAIFSCLKGMYGTYEPADSESISRWNLELVNNGFYSVKLTTEYSDGCQATIETVQGGDVASAYCEGKKAGVVGLSTYTGKCKNRQSEIVDVKLTRDSDGTYTIQMEPLRIGYKNSGQDGFPQIAVGLGNWGAWSGITYETVRKKTNQD